MLEVIDKNGKRFTIDKAKDNPLCAWEDDEPTKIVSSDDGCWHYLTCDKSLMFKVFESKPVKNEHIGMWMPKDAEHGTCALLKVASIKVLPPAKRKRRKNKPVAKPKQWLSVSEVIEMLSEIEDGSLPVLVNGKNVIEIAFSDELRMNSEGYERRRMASLITD